MKKLYILICIALFTAFANAQVSLSVSPNGGCAPLVVTANYSAPGGQTYSVSVNSNSGWQSYSTTSTTYTLTLSYGGSYYIYVDAYDASGFYLGYASQNVQVYGLGSDGINSTAWQGSCPGDDVGFWANLYSSGGTNPVYSWDLGNGTTYSQIPYQSVQGSYPNAGTYTISLQVTLPGCGTYNATDTLVVSNNAAIVPTFQTYIYPNDSVCKGDEIHLGAPNQYYLIYDYGDGTYDNNSNGYISGHAYQNNGTYYASVTAVNGCGNYFTDTDTIYVVNGLPYSGWPPQINFSGDSIVCPNTELYFYPNTNNDNIQWDFGNNDTTDLNNPVRAFATLGVHTVTLTEFNGCGSSASNSVNIYVVDTISAYGLNLTMTDSICPGSPFIVEASMPGNYNNGPGGGNEFVFDFGDTTITTSELGSHIYNTPGTYTVQVTSTNGCGNSTSDTDTIYVGQSTNPGPVFFMAPNQDTSPGSTNGTCPGDTAFMVLFPGGGNMTYVVDFGDGSPTTSAYSTLTGPGGLTYFIFKHAYSTIGTYTASLTYSTPCGGQAVVTAEVNISSSATMEDASFFYDDTKFYCLGDEYTFFSYGGSTYEWDFGDNTGTLLTNGILQPVTHTFSEPGYYNVQMIVTNGCGLKDTNEVGINVTDTRINIVTNQVKSHCGEEDGKAIAIASGGTLPYTYNWTNGDNSFIADSVQAGIYLVTVTDAMGCSNYEIATVSDQEAPAILVNNLIDVSCFGGNDGVIDIGVVGSSAPYTFVWTNGQTSEDVNNLVAGPHEVIVTDANGCVSTKSIFINEPDDYTVSFTQSTPACNLSTGTLTANVLGSSGPYYYMWSNGSNAAVNSGIAAGFLEIFVLD